MVRSLQRLPIPVINLNPKYAGRLPTITQNNPAAGRLAAEYFRRRGFSNFAFHGYQVDTILDDCRDAYREAVSAAGEPCRYFEFDSRSLPRKLDHFRHYMGHLRQWLRRLPKPVAIFASDAILGRDTANVCGDSGIHVPDEVAILAIGRAPLFCEVTHPELSQIDQNWPQIARKAAETLRAAMAGGPLPREALYVDPIGVVERHSTNTLAIGNDEVTAALVVKDLERRLDILKAVVTAERLGCILHLFRVCRENLAETLGVGELLATPCDRFRA